MRCLTLVCLTASLMTPFVVGAQHAVVNYQVADGSEVRIEVGARFPLQVQRLKAETAMTPGVPVLHQDSVQRGKVASLVKGDKLLIWQIPAGRNQERKATRATVRRNNSRRMITPFWWPKLHKPWARRTVDHHSITTTLIGWTSSGVVAARTRIIAAAGRAGFSTSELGQTRVPANDGALVFFTGTGKEMMVTFSRIGRRTGVVAHLSEVKR